ncbi:hypothetical protein K432DRAFT_378708 [Lepidopterella palustris CBS 459.81]|uniref:Autophagy protein n=1 Tax=Lepidopterella palustris CBS 459.81 TaxID=1314670 RepID=A0A8E2JJ35_9PEZI|nr:hypothetical protein K432DRAFT_378708 [Lepidopterella palustris CBS 459.81]
MGWWSSSSDKDAVDKLDPSLREFLDKESSVEYTPRPPPQTPKPVTPYTQPPQQAQPSQKSPPADDFTPKVPPQSLFPDGRYAHLWKTYEPQSAIEARGKTDQEKLADIVDTYNDRKSNIGRIAQENCAVEHMAIQDCLKAGKFSKLMMLCREENQAFNRCYELQSKFLKALGYLTMVNRPQAEDEKIQMHADSLYRKMLKQEEMIEEAKKEGRPMPEFKSVISKENISAAMAGKLLIDDPSSLSDSPAEEPDLWKGVSQNTRDEYDKKLEKLTPIQREIEKRAVEGEIAATRLYGKKIEEAFVEERIHRLKRKEDGKETIGDVLKRWWGW